MEPQDNALPISQMSPPLEALCCAVAFRVDHLKRHHDLEVNLSDDEGPDGMYGAVHVDDFLEHTHIPHEARGKGKKTLERSTQKQRNPGF